jgi:hypothetical protein
VETTSLAQNALEQHQPSVRPIHQVGPRGFFLAQLWTLFEEFEGRLHVLTFRSHHRTEPELE